MKGYGWVTSLLERGIAFFLLMFGVTMLLLLVGLVFVAASQLGLLWKLVEAVSVVFSGAGSFEAIFILLLKLIDLELIAVLIVIIALSSYQSFVDDIDHLEAAQSEAANGIRKLGMLGSQQLKGKLISTVVGLSSIGLLGVAFQVVETLRDATFVMTEFPFEIIVTGSLHLLFLATVLTMAHLERQETTKGV